MSEVPALLLMHSELTPKNRQTWSLSEHVTIGATLLSPSKWNSSALLHMSTAISHTAFGASLEVLNQYTRDLQHEP